MSGFRIEGDFEISGDALWGVIRDFGNVSWLPGKPEFESEGEGVGMIRTIRTGPLPTVREQLREIDEENRSIQYAVIEGNPMPVRDYVGTMKAIDLGGNRSRLEWSSTWEPDGISEEAATRAVRELYTGVLAAVKVNLEKR
jgi:hypothetical protein